jgi:hypothetical protein
MFRRLSRIIVGMNDRQPPFFIPNCPPEKQEDLYAALAEACGVAVPAVEQRIWAISFRHDGDVWFATVGQTMAGREQVWKGRKKTEETRNIEDPGLVLAIFRKNDLCLVYTDGGTSVGRHSKWAIPFMAGQLGLIERFSSR